MFIFALLKKLTAILFMMIFLFAYTEIGQLLKLPILIHHYAEHHNDGEPISFVQFLQKHYTDKNSHPSENNEHGKLPFKSQDMGLANATIIYQAPDGFEFHTVRPISTKVNFIYSTTFHSSPHLSRIWQPPKNC